MTPKPLIFAFLIICLTFLICNADAVDVDIPDPALEAAIRDALGKPIGPITDADMAELTSLTAESVGITNLIGLEFAINLVSLILSGNQISDIQSLVDNPGLDAGDRVELVDNPLSLESIRNHIPALRARRVDVIGVGILIPDIEGPHALSLDGDGDYVEIPYSPAFDVIEDTDRVTVEAWIRITDWDAGWWSIIDMYKADTDFGWLFEINQTDGLHFVARAGSGIVCNFVPNLNTWYHVAVSYDRNVSTITFFVNGEIACQSDFSGDIIDTVGEPLLIGFNPSGGDEYTNGLIDEIRIWNVARTPAEIQAAMNTPLQGDEPGLVGYWNFDDSSPRDLSPNANHGTLVGDAGIMPIVENWPPPRIGDNPIPDIEGPHALSLDGDGDYVQIADSDVLFTGVPFTVEAWFNIRSVGPELNTLLANDEYEIHINQASQIFAWDNGAGDFQGSTTIQTDKWYHVAFVNNGTTRKIFLNGVEDGQSEVAFPVGDVSQELWIGNDPQPPSRPFNGLLDEVRIWNVVRTPEQIRMAMNAPLQGDEPGLVGYWNFDDSTPRDFSPNANHGRLVGDAGIMPLVGNWPPPRIGDTSGDGTITAFDAALILQYVVGLIDQFPADALTAPPNTTPRDYTFSVTQSAAKIGQRVTVPVTVADATGLTAGGVRLGYDPRVLKAVNVTPTLMLNGAYWRANPDLAGEVRFAFATTAPSTGAGTLFNIEFELLPGVEGVETPLILESVELVSSREIRTVDGILTVLPSQSLLLQNYPNPFNPETWLPYYLNDNADVTIEIYSQSGASVARLELGHQAAGIYTTRTKAAYWDGRNDSGERVSSGVYFSVMRADNFSSVRKMVILK